MDSIPLISSKNFANAGLIASVVAAELPVAPPVVADAVDVPVVEEVTPLEVAVPVVVEVALVVAVVVTPLVVEDVSGFIAATGVDFPLIDTTVAGFTGLRMLSM